MFTLRAQLTIIVIAVLFYFGGIVLFIETHEGNWLWLTFAGTMILFIGIATEPIWEVYFND